MWCKCLFNNYPHLSFSVKTPFLAVLAVIGENTGTDTQRVTMQAYAAIIGQHPKPQSLLTWSPH